MNVLPAYCQRTLSPLRQQYNKHDDGQHDRMPRNGSWVKPKTYIILVVGITEDVEIGKVNRKGA